MHPKTNLLNLRFICVCASIGLIYGCAVALLVFIDGCRTKPVAPTGGYWVTNVVITQTIGPNRPTTNTVIVWTMTNQTRFMPVLIPSLDMRR